MKIILASGSPRRQQFLKDLGLQFEIKVKEIDEVYPDDLQEKEITEYLAQLKAKAFKNELHENELLVTSDTIVWLNGTALGKPKDENDAIKMLQDLSGNTHKVITSFCLSTAKFQKIFSSETLVTFKNLKFSEIKYYVTQFKPLDKAGAYGIQDWIGLVAIEKIEGSYTNVVGLPTHLFYEELHKILET